MRVAIPTMLLMIAAVGAAAGAPRPKDKEERTPVDPPAGEWSVEKIEEDGEVLRSKNPAAVEWTARFTPNKWILSARRSTIADQRVGYYQNGSVFEMDLSPEDPKTMRKGIWKIDGDRLLLCYGAPGADRPTDFAAPKDSGRKLYTLKRK
jgi:uncharacterized protein (TIGR03067 family)